MPDLTAIVQALGAIKAMKDLAQAMIGVNDAADFRERQIEFQGKIIEAQDGIFAMQQERTALTEKVSDLKKILLSSKRGMLRSYATSSHKSDPVLLLTLLNQMLRAPNRSI